ncbi:MAG: septum formation initiator family protein [Bacteroidaceae bacterium]|nr:septum formation initiator family protein [Bacteroidaceae bacterium]
MGKLLSFGEFLWNHKYFFTTLLFLLFLTFLDENNFIDRWERKKEISHLREEIDKYATIYANERQQVEDLETSAEAIEHMARERYLMRRPNEDIYIIETSEPKQP